MRCGENPVHELANSISQKKENCKPRQRIAYNSSVNFCPAYQIVRVVAGCTLNTFERYYLQYSKLNLEVEEVRMNVENRTIFQGDNLDILRGLDSETIDLIYLDPPFNSNRTYEAPIGSQAAGAAFKDAWTLSDLDNAWHGELAEHEPALYSAISAAEFSHSKSLKAYLIMMRIRVLEMWRVLIAESKRLTQPKPTHKH